MKLGAAAADGRFSSGAIYGPTHYFEDYGVPTFFFAEWMWTAAGQDREVNEEAKRKKSGTVSNNRL